MENRRPIVGQAASSLPTRFSTVGWEVRAALLRARRGAFDRFFAPPIAKHQTITTRAQPGKPFPALLAESRTPLWSDTRLAERRLQLGKVQNLRLAARGFHKVVVPAGQIVSFWKQVGRATRGRGFAPGREIREGCILPTTGGGLCQLSNALHDVALSAGAQIIERHAHSRRVPGSQAHNTGRDATVFWNYLDLRFRFGKTVRWEAVLTGTELIVRVFGEAAVTAESAAAPFAEPLMPSHVPFRRLTLLDPIETAPSCASCAHDECFRAQDPLENAARAETEATVFLLGERWPEWETYVRETSQSADRFAIPVRGDRWRIPRFAWRLKNGAHLRSAPGLALRQSLALRRMARRHAPAPQVRALQLEHAAQMAHRLAKTALSYEIAHTVVAQAYLPALWQSGLLGGRTFDVLMTGLPLAHLHARLDTAFAAHPERSRLGDFRAPDAIVQAETEALACARRIITPNAEVAAFFGERARLIPWILPPAPSATAAVPKIRAIVFAGPAAARKNAHALRDAARLLDAEVVLLYPPSGEHEGLDFWNGIRTSRPAPGTDWRVTSGSSVLVAPDWTCERPRAILSALAAGLPVVATSACGLGQRENVVGIPLDADGETIAQAVAPYLPS